MSYRHLRGAKEAVGTPVWSLRLQSGISNFLGALALRETISILETLRCSHTPRSLRLPPGEHAGVCWDLSHPSLRRHIPKMSGQEPSTAIPTA